jgi:TfoX/Sxy family transcriptional regulator of competence genes
VAYDEKLAERVRLRLADLSGVQEMKMFGGIGFLLRGNMCCGVNGTDLVIRLSHEDAEYLLADPNVRPMDLTGRPMKGWLYVSPVGIRTARQLGRWVDRAVAFASSLPPKVAERQPARRGRVGRAEGTEGFPARSEG